MGPVVWSLIMVVAHGPHINIATAHVHTAAAAERPAPALASREGGTARHTIVNTTYMARLKHACTRACARTRPRASCRHAHLSCPWVSAACIIILQRPAHISALELALLHASGSSAAAAATRHPGNPAAVPSGSGVQPREDPPSSGGVACGGVQRASRTSRLLPRHVTRQLQQLTPCVPLI